MMKSLEKAMWIKKRMLEEPEYALWAAQVVVLATDYAKLHNEVWSDSGGTEGAQERSERALVKLRNHLNSI